MNIYPIQTRNERQYMNVFREIIGYCYSKPESIALEVYSENPNLRRSVSYQQLLHAVVNVMNILSRFDSKRENSRYGLIMNNSPEWAVCDLALGLSNRVEVPVPTIFSAEQAKNLLKDVDACLVDDYGYALLEKWERRWNRSVPIKKILISADNLYVPMNNNEDYSDVLKEDVANNITNLTCKIIHTSGTTSAPKGVKISRSALGQQVTSLRSRIGEKRFDRYLSIVPLSLLIEQIVAIYLFMSYGGKLVFLDPSVPLLGSSDAHPKKFIEFFSKVCPDFVVVSPSIVEAFYSSAKENSGDSAGVLSERLFGKPQPPFIACGNAPIAPDILKYMHERGIPIMEGYGLSENTSVVTWNSLTCYRYGTVGKPLDHVEIKLSDTSELLVKSKSMFQGYTTEDPSSCRVDGEGWLHTGDVADIDEDGFLKIKGRIKHIAITADGRNISPEWVESQYKRLPFVRSVVVYGEGLQRLVGVIVVDRLDGNENDLRHKIEAFSQENCSEIERIYDYVVLEGNEQLYSEYFTITGDPIRPRFWELYNNKLNMGKVNRQHELNVG
jgi:long-subunit acyl-CoA synthetase (AMP-forming)